MKKTVRFKLKALCAALILGAAAAGVAAAADRTLADEFGTEFAINYADEGGLYRLPLTDEVFHAIRHSYKEDLAVFDASGNVAPFIVRRRLWGTPAPQPVAQGAQVPVFALPGDEEAMSRMDVTIKTGAEGRVIEVKDTVAQRAADGAKRYLLDLSDIIRNLPNRDKIESGKLSLDLGGKTNALSSVTILGSSNLKDWRTVNEREPLVRLNGGNHRLESRALTLPGAPDRYIILQIEEGGSVSITGALVEFYFTPQPETRLESDTAVFKGRDKANRNVFFYEADGVFPVEEISLRLASPGIYPVELLSRASNDDIWLRVGRLMLSLIRTPSGARMNVSVKITPPLERAFWAVSFDAAPAGNNPPTLELRWHPLEIVFLAQGKAPYTLRAGRAATNNGYQSPQLLRETLREFPEHDISDATLGEAVSRVISPVEERAPENLEWQRYLMWGVLLSGALMLSWIAWRLLQKDRQKNN